MAIRRLSDLNAAFDAGKWHLQRFQKNAGPSHALQWADPSFGSGQPPYDARVGVPLEFTPCVAQKNDAIWFPGIASGEERYLVSATFWTNQATFNGPGSVVLYDLIGYYPLIDGDSNDPQDLDNTLPLPRYADGKGVVAVMVNHIAPALQNGVCTIEYIDSTDTARSATVAIPNLGQNLVVSGHSATSAGNYGTVNLPLPGGQGIKQITRITHTTAPGGLHCIYLIQILGTAVLGDNLVAFEKDFALKDGFRLPRIYDGAWLGWFDRIGTGTSRTVTAFGNFVFAWS